MMGRETVGLISPYSDLSKYPQPLTLGWRVNHVIAYLIGGISFFIASFYYFPWINGYSVGGWLFTIGSASFLYADLNEWWKNNRCQNINVHPPPNLLIFLFLQLHASGLDASWIQNIATHMNLQYRTTWSRI